MSNSWQSKIKKATHLARDEIKKEWRWQTSKSRPRKILFDHLPKCGGTTLKTYLTSHYPHRKIYAIKGSNPSADIEIFKNFPQSKQKKFHLIIGHLANELRPSLDPSWLQITVIREPIERYISFFYYVKRIPHHYIHDYVVGNEMDLAEFTLSPISKKARNWMTVHFSGLTEETAEAHPEESVSLAVEHCKQYHLVGFLDNYPLFLNTLQKKANLVNKYNDEKLNVTDNRPQLSQISPKTLDLIKNANALDIQFFHRIREIYSPKSSK